MRHAKFPTLNSLFFCIGLSVFLFVNRHYLMGDLAFIHDTLSWSGVFHYFADALNNGIYPLWNPYVHSGSMFVEMFTQMSLIDPVNLISVAVGVLVRQQDLLIVYNFTVLAKTVVLTVGVQLLLNHLIPELKKIWSFTFFVMLLGSFGANGFHQNGAFLCIGYFPFVILFFLRSVENPSWVNVLSIGYFLGVSFQTTVFSYQATFLILFLALYFYSFRQEVLKLFRQWPKLTGAFMLFVVLSAPALAMFQYRQWIDPYARSIFNPSDQSAGILLPSAESLRKSLAAFGQLPDLMTFVVPPELFPNFRKLRNWTLSEMSFYSGFLVLLVGLWGLAKGRNTYKKLQMALTAMGLILFLGPPLKGIYDVLFFLLPTLRVLENTHSFVCFVFIGYFYFIGLGLTQILRAQGSARNGLVAIIFLFTIGELAFYHEEFYHGRQHSRNSTARSLIKADLKVSRGYSLIPREKSLIPAVGEMELARDIEAQTDSVLDLKNVRYLNTERGEERINYYPALVKRPSAFDFPKNFALDYFRILPPRTLTYPRFYSEILRSDASEELKSELLGIGLEPLQFYSHYSAKDAADILQSSNESEILEALKTSVFISPEFQTTLNAQPVDGPNEATINVSSFYPGYLKIMVDNPTPGLLLYRDGYHPSWRARVNGQERPVLRANYNQKAVALERGSNSVEFLFRPWTYMMALVAYLLGTLTYAATIVIGLFGRYRAIAIGKV